MPLDQHDLNFIERISSPSPLHIALTRQGQRWAASVRQELDRLAASSTAVGVIPLTPVRPELPVGCRLQHFAPLWAALLDDPFCSSLLYEGVVPDLSSVPPRRPPAPLRPLRHDQVQPMREMLRELLDLRVIQRLTPEEARSPFVHQHGSGLAVWRPPRTLRPCFSTYFLVTKQPAGFRGCLDLRFLNQYVRSPKFKMENMRAFKALCRPGDFYTSLDIRHAYLHLPLHPAYRQTHRFQQFDPETGLPQFFRVPQRNVWHVIHAEVLAKKLKLKVI
eukprot:SAG11_NODE_2339_length_3498_cov_2.635882_2_plen_276_part_00